MRDEQRPPKDMPELREIAAFIDGLLGQPDRLGTDPAGILVHTERPIERLGLAIEPTPALLPWAHGQALDALLLHRPWPLAAADLPAGLGLLAYHRALDDWLPVGFNRPLAAELGLRRLQAIGATAARRRPSLGMVGALQRPQPWEEVRRRVEAVFAGSEQVLPPERPALRGVAVAWETDEALVRAAAAAGAQLYVTGELRWPGVAALRETGLGLLAVGHARAEGWALRWLARRLAARWPAMRVALLPE